ncbi:WbqC family protein [Vibrio sp.]|uniref:WbqC family protein n=1 Tax=Vibrio sp. TaxID=678 RepID=UPI00311E5538
MSKKVAISQSNYIPWKGYFDLIASVDEFVLYDDMQYTRRDWRNRNKIQTPSGLSWLTIPVDVKGKYLQTIYETRVSNNLWKRKHWKSICQSYSKSKYFSKYNHIFEELYHRDDFEMLSQINESFIRAICSILNINTKIVQSKEFSLRDGKSQRLLGICADLNASEYVSGPAAKGYLDESIFIDNNIKVSWMDYSDYPEYSQKYSPFEHGVSILDLIFNEGENAGKYMKYINKSR